MTKENKKLEFVEMVNEQYGLIHGGTIGKMYEQERRVYRTNGIAPAVLTSGGGNREIKILEETHSNKHNG